MWHIETSVTRVQIVCGNTGLVVVAGLTQQNTHPFPRLSGFPVPELPDTLSDPPRSVKPEQLLEPVARVRGLVHVAPPAGQLGNRGRVDLLIEDPPAVVLNAVFYGGDEDDEGEGESGYRACGCPENGEHWILVVRGGGKVQ